MEIYLLYKKKVFRSKKGGVSLLGDMKDRMKASDIARLFGVSTTTVYKWEDAGIIKVVWKSPTGRKFYDRAGVLNLYNKSNIREETNYE